MQGLMIALIYSFKQKISLLVVVFQLFINFMTNSVVQWTFLFFFLAKTDRYSFLQQIEYSSESSQFKFQFDNSLDGLR